MKNNEVVGFRCKECGEILDAGLCGDHRIETDHKEFEAIYGELKVSVKK